MEFDVYLHKAPRKPWFWHAVGKALVISFLLLVAIDVVLVVSTGHSLSSYIPQLAPATSR